jgi:hypothetical protein
MKAVGNEPACTLRRAGDGREAPAHVTTHPPHTKTKQPAGEPGEPISPAQLNKAKPLDFVPIGWSFRRVSLLRVGDVRCNHYGDMHDRFR